MVKQTLPRFRTLVIRWLSELASRYVCANGVCLSKVEKTSWDVNDANRLSVSRLLLYSFWTRWSLNNVLYKHINRAAIVAQLEEWLFLWPINLRGSKIVYYEARAVLAKIACNTNLVIFFDWLAWVPWMIQKRFSDYVLIVFNFLIILYWNQWLKCAEDCLLVIGRALVSTKVFELFMPR